MRPETIIARLLPGEYSLSVGHPGEEEAYREFAEEIRERVPELRGIPRDEAVDKVLDAFEWAVSEVCEQLETWGRDSERSAFSSITLYRCRHPATGVFYLVVEESGVGDTGEWHASFHLTRNFREAKKSFREAVSLEKEYWSGW